ncbi:AAA family ATPase [Photobacterium damselae]
MLEFKVVNLGKIKEATFKVNKFTVITGQNGTGKSFFSKSLYSIFSVIENHSVKKFLHENLEEFKRISLGQKIILEKTEDFIHKNNLINEFDELLNSIESIKKGLDTECNQNFNLENNDIVIFKEKVSQIQKKFKGKFNALKELSPAYCGYVDEYFDFLLVLSTGLESTYSAILKDKVKDELRDNFQIQKISELINYESKELSLSCDELFEISINEDEEIRIKLERDGIDFFRKKPKSVFFESPAYWRVRDALIAAKMKSGNSYLSGVPKYFFDLDSSLKLKSKEKTLYPDIYNEIKSELNGEFKIADNELSFIENDNKISKNLVSFGMTNIGMLNTLISNNVVNEGSYIFIDEPETNLHPDWQVLMIKSLIKLSESGVNVIINTHSIEILKFIEIYFKKFAGKNIDDLLSVNFIDNDGTMLEFDSLCPYEQVKEARATLSSSYFELYMEDK